MLPVFQRGQEPNWGSAKITGLFPRLRLKESDGGYDGQDFIQWVKDTCQLVWKIVKREKQNKGNKSVALALDSGENLCLVGTLSTLDCRL